MALPKHLVVFVKAPRLGRVKTRLAADIGDVAAWAFYRRTTEAVLRRLAGSGRWCRWLAVAPDSAVDVAFGRIRGWRRIGQGGGDWGDRMARVMRSVAPGPIVIVGTDIPDISSDHVARAFHVLGDHDVAIGPAADGGYWLVGLKRCPRRPALFKNVRWSSEYALEDTLANARGFAVATLETLDDVDDGAALERWRGRARRAADQRRT